MHVPTENEVETPSGLYVNLLNPDPETITLEDIAHKLAQNNRYGGSFRWPYSVAQHAVFVSIRVERKRGSREDQLAALHHDDAEAFLGDIVRPMKPLMGANYERLTNRMDRAIAASLDLPVLDDTTRRRVKSADRYALYVEAYEGMPSKGRTWRAAGAQRQWGLEGVPANIRTPDYWLGELHWQRAAALYLKRHQELSHAEG